MIQHLIRYGVRENNRQTWLAERVKKRQMKREKQKCLERQREKQRDGEK